MSISGSSQRGDGRRARRWKKAEAVAAVREWTQSGLSAETFARRRGYSGERLRRWGHRLTNTTDVAPRVDFVPGTVVRPPTKTFSPQIVVEIGDVVVRMGKDLDADRLARIVGALSRTLRAC